MEGRGIARRPKAAVCGRNELRDMAFFIGGEENYSVCPESSGFFLWYFYLVLIPSPIVTCFELFVW